MGVARRLPAAAPHPSLPDDAGKADDEGGVHVPLAIVAEQRSESQLRLTAGGPACDALRLRIPAGPEAEHRADWAAFHEVIHEQERDERARLVRDVDLERRERVGVILDRSE